MRFGYLGMLKVSFFLYLLLLSKQVDAETRPEKVEKSLSILNQWLGDGENSKSWNRYLKTDLLRREINKGDQADRNQLVEILSRYSGKTAGLERKQFAAVRKSLELWLNDLPLLRLEELPDAALAAKDNFQPVDPEMEKQAKSAVVTSMTRLEKFLARGSKENLESWKNFLSWEKLQSILESTDAPDLKSLTQIISIFNRDTSGLELSQFIDLRDALQSYYNLSMAAQNEDSRNQFDANLTALSDELRELAGMPSFDQAHTIGLRLGVLERAGQAKNFIAAVRQHYWKPNLLIQASEQLITTGISRPVDDKSDVRDVILGTDIHGKAHTKGQVTAELVPSEDRAVILLRLQGTASSKNVGYNGPATIDSLGNTSIDARKELYITKTGISTNPATARCSTKTQITNISLSSRIGQRVAEQRVSESKAEAQRIASRHAEERVSQRMDDDAKELLKNANTGFREKFQDPLIRLNAFPQTLQFSSSEDQLQIKVVQSDSFQMAATTPPPALSAKHDLSVRVHESIVNNFFESILGGKELTDEKLAELVKDFTGDLPDELAPSPEKESWAITFQRRKPITVIFSDGGFEISIRGTHFSRGDAPVRGNVQITALYRIEKTEAGTKSTRQGEVSVTFPNSRRLNTRQVTLKTFLLRRFNELFKEEIVGKGITLPDNWQSFGTLRPQQLNCQDGWLTLGWGRQTKVASTRTD